MSRIKTFFYILLLGQEHSRPKSYLRPAIKNQCLNIHRIWKNEHYKDFGIERIIRLGLSISIFLFPGLYFRDLFGRFGLLSRKLGVEFYVLIKLILPVIFFKLDLTSNTFIAYLSGYLALETILYLATLIYLSNEFAKPISYRRSLTTLFINYIEVCLNYAVIYSYLNYSIPNFFKEKLSTDLQAIYFSFITSTTVGYGDIIPNHPIAKYLVISQTILFLIFVVLFINFFASKIQDPTYYNAKVKHNEKWQKPLNKKRKKENAI